MAPTSLRRRTDSERERFIIELPIRVITPVFGGGVHVESDKRKRQLKDIDMITPIRSAQVRGQLRFWWRAVTAGGPEVECLDALRRRESRIWGAASVNSLVATEVRCGELAIRNIPVFAVSPGSNGQPRVRARNDMREIAYGAFPLQPEKNALGQGAVPGDLHAVSGTAIVTITGPAAYYSEVSAAAQAWIAFGGIGGRTRRGFGAVASTQAVSPETLLTGLSSQHGIPGVSSLRGARWTFAARTFNTGEEALAFGLGALQHLRQGKKVGRNPPSHGSTKFVGRSLWPEPEVIRLLTNNRPNKHSERIVKVDKFPRASFGLPIIFHFQEEKGVSEPAESTLKPVHFERMSSPLILRPFERKEGGFGCVAVVLADPARASTRVHLVTPSGNHAVSVHLTRDDAKITPMAGEIDPLQRFLEFFSDWKGA